MLDRFAATAWPDHDGAAVSDMEPEIPALLKDYRDEEVALQ
jgi:hypothetical protein